MGRIKDTFKKLKAEGRKAFVGYVMTGFPDLETSKKLAVQLLEQGADALELGMPFSDPLADGPVIQRASEVALANKVTLDHVFELAAQLRKMTDKPILVMTYLNPMLSMSGTLFLEKAIHAGVDGAIIPDLPPEEAAGFAGFCKAADFDLVFLAAPTTDQVRAKRIAAVGSGFIYVVSVTGVTGERTSFDVALADSISRLRAVTDLPLVIGFGVSTPANAREAAGLGDGVVVASAVIRAMEEAQGDGLKEAVEKAKELISAVHELEAES